VRIESANLRFIIAKWWRGRGNPNKQKPSHHGLQLAGLQYLFNPQDWCRRIFRGG
jgi:hypothetical protein